MSDVNMSEPPDVGWARCTPDSPWAWHDMPNLCTFPQIILDLSSIYEICWSGQLLKLQTGAVLLK